MTKIIFSNQKIISETIPKIERAITKLHYAEDRNNRINIPSDFLYRNYMWEYKQSVIDIRNNFYSQIDRLRYANNKFDSAISELDNNLSSINNISLKQRNGII